MNFHWRKNKRIFLLLTALLSVALLSTQHLQFHVHSTDHGPARDFDDTFLTNDLEHSHAVTRHLSIDTSHADHHDVLIHEVDASPDGLVKMSSIVTPSKSLIALLFVIIFPGLFILLSNRIRHKDELAPLRRCYFTPPLRAPPL